MYIANIKTDSMVKHHLFQAFFTTRKDEWTNVVVRPITHRLHYFTVSRTRWPELMSSPLPRACSFRSIDSRSRSKGKWKASPSPSTRGSSRQYVPPPLKPHRLTKGITHARTCPQQVSFLMAERKDGEFRMELEWVKAINTRLRKGARYTGLIQDLD